MTLLPEKPLSFVVKNPVNQPPTGVVSSPTNAQRVSVVIDVTGYAWDPDGRITLAQVIVNNVIRTLDFWVHLIRGCRRRDCTGWRCGWWTTLRGGGGGEDGVMVSTVPAGAGHSLNREAAAEPGSGGVVGGVAAGGGDRGPGRSGSRRESKGGWAAFGEDQEAVPAEIDETGRSDFGRGGCGSRRGGDRSVQRDGGCG